MVKGERLWDVKRRTRARAPKRKSPRPLDETVNHAVTRLPEVVAEHDERGHLLLSPRGNPLRTTVYCDDFYLCLDPGIRFPVRVLHSYGIETCQSCAGSGPFGLDAGKLDGDAHSYLEPTIDMVAIADDALGFAAMAHLQTFALPVKGVAIYWSIKHGVPYEKLWRITFSRTMEDLADDRLMFIWGYQAQ